MPQKKYLNNMGWNKKSVIVNTS